MHAKLLNSDQKHHARPLRTDPRGSSTLLRPHWAPRATHKDPQHHAPKSPSVQNSPHTTPAAACPVQNSPSTSKNADFGPFSACWAKIFTLTAQPTDAGRILSRTGHVNTSSLKDKSPLREVLGAIVKHFSPMRVHKSQFWPFSTEQGRCFFHRRLMPGTRAIRWGDISFRTRPRQPTKPPTRTRPTRHQQPSSTARTGRPGRDAGE